MVATIPRERLLAPLNPVGDFQTGKTEILVGFTQEQWEDLRDAVVQSNFSRKEPYVLYCPKPTNVHRFSPLSKWEISKLVVAQMRADGTLWKTVAILVCTVAALLGLSKLALWYIARQKERLAAGGWFVNTYIHGRFISSRPFSQSDVNSAYGEIAICGFGTLAFTSLLIRDVLESVQQAYQQVRRGIAGGSETGQVYVLQIKQNASSGTSLAESMKEDETVKNILSQQELSKEQVRAPRMIAMGRYITNVRGMVLRVLEKATEDPLKLHHPFEDRDMTEAEQEKFLTDCANLFSIDREKLLACWQAKVPLESLNKAVSMYPEAPREYMEKHLDGLWRNRAFMELLPANVWAESCRDWPIPPRELLPSHLAEPSDRGDLNTLSDFRDLCLHVPGAQSPDLFD